MAHISLPVLAKFLILIFRIEYLENADPASRAAMTHPEVDLPQRHSVPAGGAMCS